MQKRCKIVFLDSQSVRFTHIMLDGEIVCLNSMKAARNVHKVQGNLRRLHSIGSVMEATMNAIAKQDEHPDHLRLKELLEEAKPLMLPMYSDQQKVWVAQSPIAQEIKSILAKHPEYYAEVSAVVGDKAFPKPR